MAHIWLEWDGKRFRIDDDAEWDVYVDRQGPFAWRVEVRPGIGGKPVLSLDANTSTIADMTRKTLRQIIAAGLEEG